MSRTQAQTGNRFIVPPRVFACLLFTVSSCLLHAQCTDKNYIQDGTPSARRDCQPLAQLKRLPPDAMSPADQELISARHTELAAAAQFYGFDLDAGGWTYQQAASPLLRKHVMLIFTNETPSSRASRFTALVPSASGEKVQIVSGFTRGLRPYLPGWESNATFAVFNRLMNSEVGERRVSTQGDWIQYAVLYLTLIGRDPSVPTDTDSIQANWNLSAKRGTTPVIFVKKDGAAMITCSDLADPSRMTIWKLVFNQLGQIQKTERSQRDFVQPKHIPMSGPDGQIVPATTQH